MSGTLKLYCKLNNSVNKFLPLLKKYHADTPAYAHTVGVAKRGDELSEKKIISHTRYTGRCEQR